MVDTCPDCQSATFVAIAADGTQAAHNAGGANGIENTVLHVFDGNTGTESKAVPIDLVAIGLAFSPANTMLVTPGLKLAI